MNVEGVLIDMIEALSTHRHSKELQSYKNLICLCTITKSDLKSDWFSGNLNKKRSAIILLWLCLHSGVAFIQPSNRRSFLPFNDGNWIYPNDLTLSLINDIKPPNETIRFHVLEKKIAAWEKCHWTLTQFTFTQQWNGKSSNWWKVNFLFIAVHWMDRYENHRSLRWIHDLAVNAVNCFCGFHWRTCKIARCKLFSLIASDWLFRCLSEGEISCGTSMVFRWYIDGTSTVHWRYIDGTSFRCTIHRCTDSKKNR